MHVSLLTESSENVWDLVLTGFKVDPRCPLLDRDGSLCVVTLMVSGVPSKDTFELCEAFLIELEFSMVLTVVVKGG